ncbi:MAG: hypothetical protein HY960_11930 [Ignavibacteriae bacterium]|nr:hypothetical protein [Ignavibacteriota bacterium]
MNDPLTIENRFQTLKQSLPLLSSKRMKLLEILEFIEQFSSEDATHYLIAYLPELLSEITTSILQTDFTGTNPEFLFRLKNLLDVSSKVLRQDKNEELSRALEHLKQEEEKFASWQHQQTNGLFSTTKPKSFSTDKVWIPMVEHEPILTELPPEFATLSQLRVDVSFSPKPIQQDELHVTQFAENNKNNHQELRSALIAAKDFFERVTHIKIKRKLIVRCTFEHANLIIGESLCAGLAAVIFTDLLRLHQYKEEFSIRPDVAITGALDSSGKLLPVDSNGLKLKVEACLFSPIRFLVVPKQQCKIKNEKFPAERDAARRQKNEYLEPSTVNHLQPTTYDLKPFEIVGIENFSELFFNRRLTDSRRIPLAKQAGRKLWKHRLPIAATIIVLLLLVIWKILYGPMDMNPVSASFAGEMMTLKNRMGESVDVMQIGSESVNHQLHNPRILSFLDINKDAINEVFWIEYQENTGLQTAVIKCKDISTNEILWTSLLKKYFHFPKKPETKDDNFIAGNLEIGDFDNNGTPEIILKGGSPYFHQIIVKLDASTGEEIGCYLHIGGVGEIKMIDLENDGITEIIVPCIDQPLRSASIFILDPRFITGHSPTQGDYITEGVKPGLERTYINIPKTIVGEAFKYQIKYSLCFIEDIQKKDKQFKVNVHDVNGSIGNREYYNIYTYFNFDLSPAFVTTGDPFDMLAESLFVNKRINRLPDYEYFNEWMKTIKYWDGYQWGNTPTVNKRWLQALKERGLPIPPGIPDSLLH